MPGVENQFFFNICLNNFILQDTIPSRNDSPRNIFKQVDTLINIPLIENPADTSISNRQVFSSDSVVSGNLPSLQVPSSVRPLTTHRPISPSANQTIETSFDDVPYLSSQDSSWSSVKAFSLEKSADHFFSPKDSSRLVYLEGKNTLSPAAIKTESMINSNSGHLFDPSPDWLLVIVIGSLVLLAWLKLFYHKFFDQIINSMWNYQLSLKALRDKNIFSRRVSFILNINFVLITGSLIYLILTHYRINPFQLKPVAAFAVYSAIIAMVASGRFMLTRVTGYIFNKNEYFKEYMHQVFIIYKNLGIYLIPLIIALAYIQEDLRKYLAIFGIGILVLAYMFRFAKGIQLIIKKDTLIFYLILYLCTLEILPILVAYKLFSSLI